MKNLKNFICESKPTFDVQSDVYNVLSELANKYYIKNKKLNKSDWEGALEWFMIQFFDENAEGLL